MHFTEMDAYFHMAAQGNAEAFDGLYNEFSAKAANLIKILIRFSPNYTGNPADFHDLIDSYFITVLNEFDSRKGTFSSYVEYICGTRLSGRVKQILATEANTFAPIEEEDDDIVTVESFHDPKQLTIPKDLAVKNFKYKISSPRKGRTTVQRLRDKIILLQYAGYSNVEICKYLKLTYSQLRTHLSHIKEERDVVNLKLELK